MPENANCHFARFHVFYVDDWNGKTIPLTHVPVCEHVARAMVREENEKISNTNPNSPDYTYYAPSEAWK